MSGRFNLDAFDPAAERERLIARMGCEGMFRSMSDEAILAQVILGEDIGLSAQRVMRGPTYVEIETRSVDFQRPEQIRAMLAYVIVQHGHEMILTGQSTFGEEMQDYGGPYIGHGLTLRFDRRP